MNREEAINVVKCNWPEGQHLLSEALKTLIPEFQESEDERVRKEIVGFIDNVLKDKNVLLLVADRIGDNIPSMIPGWIAYLEKQKEPKPESCDCSRDEESYINGIHHVLMNPEAYGLIKQKPAEWSEEDEGMLNCIIATLCEESHGGRETNDKMVTWLENRLKSLRPQPHWKPSEEHFQGLRRAIIKAEKGSDAWNSLTDLYEHLKNL